MDVSDGIIRPTPSPGCLRYAHVGPQKAGGAYQHKRALQRFARDCDLRSSKHCMFRNLTRTAFPKRSQPGWLQTALYRENAAPLLWQPSPSTF